VLLRVCAIEWWFLIPPLQSNVSALPWETWTRKLRLFSHAMSQKRHCFGLLYLQVSTVINRFQYFLASIIYDVCAINAYLISHVSVHCYFLNLLWVYKGKNDSFFDVIGCLPTCLLVKRIRFWLKICSRLNATMLREFLRKGGMYRSCLQVVAKVTCYWVGRPSSQQQQMTQLLHSW